MILSRRIQEMGDIVVAVGEKSIVGMTFKEGVAVVKDATVPKVFRIRRTTVEQRASFAPQSESTSTLKPVPNVIPHSRDDTFHHALGGQISRTLSLPLYF